MPEASKALTQVRHLCACFHWAQAVRAVTCSLGHSKGWLSSPTLRQRIYPNLMMGCMIGMQCTLMCVQMQQCKHALPLNLYRPSQLRPSVLLCLSRLQHLHIGCRMLHRDQPHPQLPRAACPLMESCLLQTASRHLPSIRSKPVSNKVTQASQTICSPEGSCF